MNIPTQDQISEELREVALQVHQAQERPDERDLVLAAQQGVERLSARYREMYAALSAGDQLKVDRALGRRVVDIKRLASLLPKVAQHSSESTPDRQVAGASAVGERRITGVSWSHGRSAGGGPTLGVGREVEAWCGKCGQQTTHHIVAMVGDTPKQVLCQVCNSRHTYRTSPARRTGDGAAAPSGGQTKVTLDPETQRKNEQQRTLAQAIEGAAEIRPFDAKGRYKAGEIISHPLYGRGKIENVLRSSLLVRFAVGGLKSLMLS